ncbi:MAG: hypothetical protein E7554_04825 [Ruminococcaceae bacterium]|nr:hypothetical protein [Oscillospiraceae bacterium]
MDSKKRRRRRRKARISLPTIVLMFLLLVLIPLICLWFGHMHVEKNVPDHATGYVVESAYSGDTD